MSAVSGGRSRGTGSRVEARKPRPIRRWDTSAIATDRLEKLGWKIFGAFTDAHVAAYKATGGRIGRTFFKGAPVCLVDHVGRKSGKQRTTPLIYIRDGEAIVLVASKGGAPSHPAWWINLRANPEASVQVNDEKWQVRAREATDAERERLWPRLVEVWPPYDEYQAKTDRRIPVVLLEPRGDAGPA